MWDLSLCVFSGWSLRNYDHHHHHQPDEDVDQGEWTNCGQTGRTDAPLSVSSPWTTPDYLTNKIIIVIVMIWISEHLNKALINWIQSLLLLPMIKFKENGFGWNLNLFKTLVLHFYTGSHTLDRISPKSDSSLSTPTIIMYTARAQLSS